MRHLIDEGVGLRQIIDYYFCLRQFKVQSLEFKDSGEFERFKSSRVQIIYWLGMKRFAGALMWVMRELLLMPEEMLLCSAVEKDGRFLMKEILMAGNFGHEDPRMAGLVQGLRFKVQVNRARRRFKRNMRFLTSYPGEVIWEPIIRVRNFAWKKLKLWNIKIIL